MYHIKNNLKTVLLNHPIFVVRIEKYKELLQWKDWIMEAYEVGNKSLDDPITATRVGVGIIKLNATLLLLTIFALQVFVLNGFDIYKS